MGAATRPSAYAAVGVEPRPDAPAGFARLNPWLSRVVDDHVIGYMIIYRIWLKSYFGTTRIAPSTCPCESLAGR